MKKSIGKSTLGGGNKMKVELHGYERSTHNLSRIWRNTQAAGTLVPNFVELVTAADTFDMEVRSQILTHPTIGPLYGQYKEQIDYFFCPMRLYIAQLHNNALNIGLNMKQVKLPQIQVALEANDDGEEQIHPSSLLAYLGLRSFGSSGKTPTQTHHECLPLLMYFDIFKNYYMNKQEEYFPMLTGVEKITQGDGYEPWNFDTSSGSYQVNNVMVYGDSSTLAETGLILLDNTLIELYDNLYFDWKKKPTIPIDNKTYTSKFSDSFKKWTKTTPPEGLTFVTGKTWYYLNPIGAYNTADFVLLNLRYAGDLKIGLFPTEDLDNLREYLLTLRKEQAIITTDNTNFPEFIRNFAGRTLYGNSRTPQPTENKSFNTSSPMFGLCLKTYQSDIFNNWINTEWIDGENGINQITAIDTSSGSFTLDTFALSKKVYNMLNRIGISGGSYKDWVEVNYDSRYIEQLESPMYLGGYASEIEFQEVISNAATSIDGESQPLGSLGGRGVQTNRKGGRIKFRINEPGYIIGISSITPRVDYCQGNKWFTTLETMDDIHKPALDGIGFQDLTTNKMVGATEKWNENIRKLTSIGKQPAWLDYMTSFNENYGNFAIKGNEAFMVLNRWYDKDENGNYDWSTYVDPSKYNDVFADTSVDAQNFWVQIYTGVKARRRMSAKIMPQP